MMSNQRCAVIEREAADGFKRSFFGLRSFVSPGPKSIPDEVQYSQVRSSALEVSRAVNVLADSEPARLKPTASMT